MVKVFIQNAIKMDKLLDYAKDTGAVTAGQVAKEVYEKSQQRCPTQTGKLKNSGSIIQTQTGYEVEYNTDYALLVENKPQSMLSSGTAHFLSGALAEVTKGGVQIG